MIPVHKLMKLPRHQSLRKMCKIFTQAEKELSVSVNSIISTENNTPLCSNSSHVAPLCKNNKNNAPLCTRVSLEYLQEIAGCLVQDKEFSESAAKALISAKTALNHLSDEGGNLSLIRACNSIRHILLTETGQQTADWDFIDHSGNLDSQKRKVFAGMKVFLEDIRSPFNVGSMFRSAESFGVEKILLSPLCSDPHHPRAQRTAMGCISVIAWERTNLDEIEGPLFVLETGGTNMSDFDFPAEGTMIIGSEELGASPKALELAEKSLGRVTIQTYGAKGSLNAGTAFGIALQAWAKNLATRQFLS